MKALFSISLRRPRRDSGAALVITLAMLVLMAIMVVSLSDIMRIERGSARSHLEKSRSEVLAQLGVDRVVGTLQMQTADTTRNWISQPGQLVASASGAVSTPVPLSSGAPVNVSATTTPTYYRPANLNIAVFGMQTTPGALPPHLITEEPDPNNPSNAVPMFVKWIYVRLDGTEDADEKPDLTNTANPIVGRYAYWTDDESSKVNYNLAWKRNNNPNPASHPTQINLPSLLGTDPSVTEPMADALHLYLASPSPKIQTAPASAAAYKALNRFFYNSPEDARRVQSLKDGVYDALSLAKFNVTHYNHDPDTTFFNEPRFVLTTQKSRAGTRVNAPNGPLFLDILNTDNSDPGPFTNINAGKLQKVIDKLDSYLSRTDWPITTGTGASFQSKYYAGDAQRLKQLSLNIVDYVRCKESVEAGVGVAPMRFSYPAGGSLVIAEATDANAFIGATRAPLITEVGLYIPASPAKPTAPQTYTAKLKIELYLPANYGIASLDLTQLGLFRSIYVDSTDGDSQSLSVSAAESAIVASEVVQPSDGSHILTAGNRAIISRNVTITYPKTGNRPTGVSNALFRIAIARGSGGDRVNIAPLLGTKADYAKCKVNDPGTTEANMPSAEVDDPRCNSYKDDWQPAKPSTGGAGNTFGQVNSISTLGAPPSANPPIVPEQDTDNTGAITDISLVMPAPSGTPGNTLSANPDGIMASSGELGFLSTGMQSAAAAGISWRTLRLQPSKQGTDVVPDWAYMDLFTVPADVPATSVQNPATFYAPHGNATGGRVNMNAHPEPFDMERTAPLAAVFENARNDANNLSSTISSSTAQTLATNVYNGTLAPGTGLGSPGKSYGYDKGYDSPGEIVEIKGVADGGEATEQCVRDVANLITARGNVFSIYTVGQALKQTASQMLITTGEQRQEAMVERYLNPSDNTVHFRQVYFRNLLP